MRRLRLQDNSFRGVGGSVAVRGAKRTWPNVQMLQYFGRPHSRSP